MAVGRFQHAVAVVAEQRDQIFSVRGEVVDDQDGCDVRPPLEGGGFGRDDGRRR
jgi:hypothetical protein